MPDDLQFNDITTAVDRGRYPEPARGFINSPSFVLDIARTSHRHVCSGANFYDKLLWATVLPIILVCFIVFVFLVQICTTELATAQSGPPTIRRLWASHVNVIMVLLYLILERVHDYIQHLVCQQIDGNCTYRLSSH